MLNRVKANLGYQNTAETRLCFKLLELKQLSSKQQPTMYYEKCTYLKYYIYACHYRPKNHICRKSSKKAVVKCSREVLYINKSKKKAPHITNSIIFC